MTRRCRDCDGKPRLFLKTGSIMEGAKLGCQTWAIAVCLVMTGLNGVRDGRSPVCRTSGGR